jgi:hypothetical protein
MPAAPLLAKPNSGKVPKATPVAGEAKLTSVHAGRLEAERRSRQCRPASAVTYRPAGAGISHSSGEDAQNPEGLASEPVCSTDASDQVPPPPMEV